MKEKYNATLVLLSFNEIEGLNNIYDKIPLNKFNQVFAIDPGSTDGTLNFYKEKGMPFIIQEKRGRAEAFRIGIKEAKHESVVFFSVDGNEDPQDISKLLDCLEEGYDMAIASRFLPASQADDSNEALPYRTFGNRMFTIMANVLFGGKLKDSINGFRAIKKQKFLELDPDTEGFGIEYQMSIRAMKKGFKIKEIPTIEADRIGGVSTAHTWSTGWLFVGLIMKELFKK
ncbi:MAG: glycosyltransferase family 2 protein [archaeon]